MKLGYKGAQDKFMWGEGLGQDMASRGKKFFRRRLNLATFSTTQAYKRFPTKALQISKSHLSVRIATWDLG